MAQNVPKKDYCALYYPYHPADGMWLRHFITKKQYCALYYPYHPANGAWLRFTRSSIMIS